MDPKKRVKFFTFVLLILATGSVIYIIYAKTFNISRVDQEAGQPVQFDQEIYFEDEQQSDKQRVHLYFADKEKPFLNAEERILSCSNEPAVLGRAIIEALIDGPKQDLMRTIPAEAKLRALYLTQDSIAYVDITKEIKTQHPGGTESELLTIYSIVNSIVLNISDIDAIKILIDGRESMTLAGHIDLQFPFRSNMLIVR